MLALIELGQADVANTGDQECAIDIEEPGADADQGTEVDSYCCW